jgi:C1A family cysteine protease
MATTIPSDDVLAARLALTTAPAADHVRGMGWLRDWPDQRDYTADHPEVRSELETLQIVEPADVAALPATVDLRAWFSPVEDQEALGSCTANAGMGVLEYFERRAFGKYIDGSRLFLYKVTRDLLGWTGDTGAFLRTTMGALALFGAPPEKFWPYAIARFDDEPSAFLYSFGADYRAVKYYRLDPPGTTPSVLLSRIKTNLAAGIPAMFGFTVYASISQAAASGKIPYPALGEAIRGGHAIVVAGYDDGIVIKNMPSGPQTTGAFLIRNSWGTVWGDAGYGWLPYDYVLHSIAVDWWSLITARWVSTNEFGL